jgi:hypothetical protein
MGADILVQIAIHPFIALVHLKLAAKISYRFWFQMHEAKHRSASPGSL